MLWEVEITPKGHDAERERVAEEYDLLTHSRRGTELVAHTARGYLLEGNLSRGQAERLMNELLVDPVAETGRLGEMNVLLDGAAALTVLLKPGVYREQLVFWRCVRSDEGKRHWWHPRPNV